MIPRHEVRFDAGARGLLGAEDLQLLAEVPVAVDLRADRVVVVGLEDRRERDAVASVVAPVAAHRALVARRVALVVAALGVESRSHVSRGRTV
jgi:hypothetical protein